MTNHTDFASPAAAAVYDPWAGTMARHAAARATSAAKPQPVDTTVAPPSLALHARQVAPPGAPVAFASVPGLPDIMRAAGPVPDLDRTLHPSFPGSTVEHRSADASLPVTVSATVDRTFHPVVPALAMLPAPLRAPVASEGRGTLDATLTAAQFAAVARSRAKLDRARSYATRLGAHAAEIRGRLQADGEYNVMAAIGTAEADSAELAPLRGEAVEVDRQHRQALDALGDIEAEHARHEADLVALTGSDGAARAKLADAHAARALAQTAADDAKALLDRAAAHAGATSRKLDAARAEEARHDADATARLRAALADGEAIPTAAEPFARTSPALEDDLRHARATVDTLAAEHAGKVKMLEAAYRAVLGAADGVMCAEAEAMARELNAADARALALRVRLHCFTNRRASDWVAPPASPPKMMPGGWLAPDPAAYAVPLAIRQTAVIGQALAAAPAPQTGGLLSNAWAAETAGWDAYAAALAADPQAEPAFTEGPASAPAAPLPASRAA